MLSCQASSFTAHFVAHHETWANKKISMPYSSEDDENVIYSPRCRAQFCGFSGFNAVFVTPVRKLSDSVSVYLGIFR